MTRIECERLVERYLEGSMDFAAEQDFFIQVALDDELRRTLKAYRVVEETIRKEREAGEVNHGAARRLVAASLIVAPQAEPAQGNAPASREKRRTVRGFIVALGSLAFLFGGMAAFDQWNAASADALQDPVQVTTTTEVSGLPVHAEDKEANDGTQKSNSEKRRYEVREETPTASHSLSSQESLPADEASVRFQNGAESASQAPSASVVAQRMKPEETESLSGTSSAEVATGSADPKLRIDSTAGRIDRSENASLRVEFDDFNGSDKGRETHGN